MGRNTTNARLLERVFMFVSQTGECRTDRIHEYYGLTYGTLKMPRLANMTQSLLSSGLFKRVGWYDRSENELMRTSLSSKELGLNSRRWVCVVDVKNMDEIIDKYISGKKTLRRLENMPSFVREAVKGGSQ